MNKIFANFFVFTTGAVIMAIELTASRLLAPYFGTSIFVWGNVIGVVMITLAIGYWWGGRLADKKPQLQTLAALIFICGIFLALLPIIFKPFLILIFGFFNSISLFALAVLCFWALLIILALPLIILGMSSPFVIRLVNEKVETTGKTAGSIFALSTLGSIFGVFMATFVTIPFLGSMQTIMICSAILILLAGLSFKSKYKIFALLVFIPIFIYLFFSASPVSAQKGLVYEKETPYQYIKVIEKDGWTYLHFNEGAAIQSYINFTNPHFLTGESYYDFFNFLPYLNSKEDKDKSVLILGGGGGTAAKQLVSFWQPKIEIDFVEIDKEVIDVAKTYFKMNEEQIETFNQDGRLFLKMSDTKYDYIIIDAYSNQLYIPFYMATDQFFQLTKEKNKSDGIVAMNVNAENFESRLLQQIIQTIRKNFENVYVLEFDNSYNYLIFASDVELDFNKNVDNNLVELAEKFYNIKKIDNWSEEMILTDNHAPVEFLTDKMVLEVFLNYIIN